MAGSATTPTDLSARKAYLRPVTVAVTFTFLGEMLILYVWGMNLFSDGVFWRKAVWTSVCGVAMGAVIGALVNLIVTERLDGPPAAVTAGFIYFGVLAGCVALCFEIDLATGGAFGAHDAPLLFVFGGLIPAFFSAFVYAWLLYARPGRSLLDRIGY